MRNRIIKDYLESLKEDNELDYIFPMLLDAMNFRIVTTPRNSKGQSQYGKDIVAIGKDAEGVLHRWYFELKGNAAKDINDATFLTKDGVRDSILAAKYTPYKDSSIPMLNNLPFKIVFVHNGILVENTRPTFDGFIETEFPKGGFERWDIEYLTKLFSEHLFNECLFCDDESYFLFKKILVLLDAPGWNTKDLDRLIDIQLEHCPTNLKRRRLISKCFASINLLLNMIYYYSQDAKNLLPAKMSSDRIILKVWAWILKNKLEKKQLIVQLFNRIVLLHLTIYSAYLQKLLPLATQYKGLYMYNGSETEVVCYPLRCYDFMNDLLYYFIAHNIINRQNSTKKMISNQNEIIKNILKNNSGFDVPLLDTHAITLQLMIGFIFGNEHDESVEVEFYEFISRLIMNTIIRKKEKDMFPELHGNRTRVAKSLYKKSAEYRDESSLFLMTLVEVIAWMDAEPLYIELRKVIKDTNVNLQVSYPIESDKLEINLFEKQLHEELSVQTNIELPGSFIEFKESYEKRYDPIELSTSKTHFSFLIILAHIHYQTDWFPDFLNLGFWKPMDKKGNMKKEK